LTNTRDLTPTPSQTVGPYLHLGLTDRNSVSCLASNDVQGERMRLSCRVLDGDGIPVPDAMIELWQADSAGNYNHPDDPRRSRGNPAFHGYGRLPTGDDGICIFETIKPGPVPGLNGQMQAPHFNVSVLGRGLLKRLSTRIYFAGEALNSTDQALALVPADRRHTLLAEPESERPNGWRFDVRLCGEGETVFFDV